MKVALVGNRDFMDGGVFEEFFADRQDRVVAFEREEPSSWTTIDDVDLCYHLGSDWSVYSVLERSRIEAEAALIRNANRRGIPVIGVCFGAQLISQVFGGRVSRLSRPEIGWCEVAPSITSPIFGGRWMQWHYDSFSVPDGFDVLATNVVGVQVIRRGRLLGTQFHPEVTEPMISKWIHSGGEEELFRIGISPSDLLAETRQEVQRTAMQSRRLIEWFLSEVS
jgi:GMP synthase-like glutamine amidotransferase